MRGRGAARRTLAASFKVVPTSLRVPKGRGVFPSISKDMFRGYKILKGKKIPLKDTYIQKLGKRLSAGTEVFEIMEAKKKKRRRR